MSVCRFYEKGKRCREKGVSKKGKMPLSSEATLNKGRSFTFRYEYAGLQKLGIINLFSNLVKGVEKTFLPLPTFDHHSNKRPRESPHASKTVFVYQPRPDSSSTKEQ